MGKLQLLKEQKGLPPKLDVLSQANRDNLISADASNVGRNPRLMAK